MRTIAIAAQKGGVGKSTVAHAAACVGHADGLRVLGIDLDPQGTLTALSGCDRKGPGAYELVNGKAGALQCIRPAPWGSVVPASAALRDLGGARLPADGKDRPDALERALRPVASRFDVAIVDTAPRLDALAWDALYMADLAVIPTTPDRAAAGTLQPMLRQVMERREALGRPRRVALALTMADGRTKVGREYAGIIRGFAAAQGVPSIGPEVRRSVAVADAQARGECLALNPKHPAGRELAELARAMLTG